MMYEGGELTLFAEAHRWKQTLRELLSPYLGSQILEVGAGVGGTTGHLCRGTETRWICLEPDPSLARQIAGKIADGILPRNCGLMVGTLADLPTADRYDTVLYVDVLEHIADDAHELALARTHLLPSGHLIVVAPAHNFLSSPFDRAIGHFRRYSTASLAALTPPDMEVVSLHYVDACGLLLSLANRLMLRQTMPTSQQIEFWDKVMVPLSRLVDPLLGRRLGKTAVAIWRQLPPSSPRAH